MDKLFIEKLNIIDRHTLKLKCLLTVLQSYTETEMTYSQTVGNIYEIVAVCLDEVNSVRKYI